MGAAGLAIVAPTVMLGAWATGRVAPLDAGLALFAGFAAMVATGPVTVHRAQGKIRPFTATALLLQAGMTAPRLLGLLLGGVTGCFAVLAAWYGLAACLLAPPGRGRERAAPVLPIVRSALPMFAFSWLWLAYLLANRWLSSMLSGPTAFGLFAFGANLAFTAVVILLAVAQVRYPAVLAGARLGPCPRRAMATAREAVLLAAALGVAVACAIPLAGPVIDRVFPYYRGGEIATAILAISCVPVGIAAWYMPVVVALVRAPIAEAFLVLGGAFVALGLGMTFGDAWSGIVGQAWGCVAGGLVLLAGLVAALARLGILERRGAVAVLAFAAVECLMLAGLVAAVGPGAPGAALAASGQAPPEGWRLAFEDRFETLSLWERGIGTWQPSYPAGSRTNAANRELQYYVDPREGRDPPELRQPAPFRTGSDGLAIVARPLPPGARPPFPGAAYRSGMLTSARSFSFRYGYVEIVAQVPRGKGLWPAFWLLPVGGGWPPEIDVMEVLGDDPDGFWATLHGRGTDGRREVQGRVAAEDLSRGFHAYGVLWGHDEIVWYLDGRPVFSAPTPADFHVAMYLIVNLAVGGGWPGAPDPDTSFPAEFRIRRISVHLPPATASNGATR